MCDNYGDVRNASVCVSYRRQKICNVRCISCHHFAHNFVDFSDLNTLNTEEALDEHEYQEV